MIYHVLTNISPWGPEETYREWDSQLSRSGSTAVRVVCGDIPLEEDGLHFTKKGQTMFYDRLYEALPPSDNSLLIISDSTVDYHNRDNDDNWTGWANREMTERFNPRRIVVDTVRGSGFTARATHNEHFYPRLSAHIRNGFHGDILFIGGWNDHSSLTNNAIDRCVKRAMSSAR